MKASPAITKGMPSPEGVDKAEQSAAESGAFAEAEIDHDPERR